MPCRSVPLTALRQKPPEVYRLAANDVLGVYIEGILPANRNGDSSHAPARLSFPPQLDPAARGLPASLGYPIPVHDNGAVSLPLIDPVMVQGRSVAEAELAIRQAYVGKGILQAGRMLMTVSLMSPRVTRVTVIRQEVGGFTSGASGIVATTTKFGTGHVANMRAYENDVLTALAETGGMPGQDAYADIYVFKHAQGNPALVQTLAGAYARTRLAPIRTPVFPRDPYSDPRAPLPTAALPPGRRHSGQWRRDPRGRAAAGIVLYGRACCRRANTSCRATTTWTWWRPSPRWKAP